MVPLVNFADNELFGNDAGEDEAPSVLASYFVDQPSFKAFLDRDTRLQAARSRKGMGKSALLSKFAYDLRTHSDNQLIIPTTGTDLFGIALPENYEYLPLQKFWKQVLCARINFELANKIGFAFSDTTMALVEHSELSGYRERNLVGALLSQVSSSKIPIELKNKSQPNHDVLLKKAFDKYDDLDVWLLIDDIDSNFVNDDKSQAITSTFFLFADL